ncbi:hypothetical protein PDESU_00330 [Pontiella desulfatans]|uniref:Alginate lyase domain-containing protein n=2 Tax=Pontiella desulfatans TaxID=2750659 RepID=A0A6C2TWA6_PONDE|nr:hypothetical protein PDESU_00330 [Pontiella desulfatans]
MNRMLLMVPLLWVGFAEAKPIGDFRTMENWTGLGASTLKTPCGEFAALLPPGTATFTYTEPKTFLSGETVDFSDMLDEVCVEDWYDYRYLECWVWLPHADPVELECSVLPLAVGRPDYVKSLAAKVTVQGEGWQKVVFSLSDFDYVRHQGAHWKHIQGLKISTSGISYPVVIGQPRLKKSRMVALDTPIKSKSAKAGETAVYELQLENESSTARNVSLVLEHTGWEACPATLSENELILQPWETKKVTLSVQMNDLVAPGGRELRKVTVVPDGRGDLKEELALITVRELPHPYLLHTEAGWEKVKQKAATVEWAKAARQDYIDKAKKWRVPAARTKGDYSFKNTDGKDVADCAIAWKLSGDEKLAQKVVQFLRAFSDPETGYPTTIRNSGALVHRGMFFLHMARAYDLLYNHPSFTEQDHANIESAMRLYNRWVDYQILTGDGNNHQDGLVAGALMNGLALQDFAEVERFLHGTGGLLDLIGQGVLDDGHYFEGTANYNILAGNLFNSVAVALEPWGLNLKDWKIPAKYGKHIMVSPWALSGEFLGMSFERQGPSTRTYRQLKDIWDAVLPMADWRGVVFASNDSGGIDLTTGHSEAGFGFEMAYHLWPDPAYVPLLKKMKKRDLLYGAVELPDVDGGLGSASYVNDNAGFAVLRSKAEEPRERYQVVQRYGTHGGYHGHFDKTSLVSLSRFGRSHYNTEASWFGYWSFMFKMWVQTSDAHNMTVVDHRMQKPAETRRILFHSGDLMQVSATEIETEWIDPPYGGQTPYALKMPEEKTWDEARWLPTPENPRPQGSTGTPSEPILQRRLIITTDDYVVMADDLKGTQTHDFDNLFNCKGLVELAAEKKTFVKHTAQCDPDPYGSAQFITDCNWYETAGTVKAGFVLDGAKGEMGGRHSCSEPGVMNVDYYSLWPKKAGLMVGNYAESLDVARHLYYKVSADGTVLAEGKLAPWILGSAEIDVDVRGMQTLEIETRIEKAKAPKTIFLGSPKLLDAAGEEIPFEVQAENVAEASGKNLDYAGGTVSIFGEHHSRSIAAEPADRKKPGMLKIDLKGAARFKATLGGDYPVGGDDIHRKIIATRSTGKEARFLSAVELHEDNPVIKSIQAVGNDEVVVLRRDGSVDRFKIAGLGGRGVSVEMTVELDGKVIAAETAEAMKRVP